MSANNSQAQSASKKVDVRYLTVTAMLSAIAFVLMYLDFSIPMLIPSFVKMDLSELPAIIGSFAMGPLCGVLVCLIKNLLHCFVSTTGFVGEASNFVLGVAFVLPAGLIYKAKKTKKNALIGSLIGSVAMAVISYPSNLFIMYPLYYNFLPEEAVLGMYQAILPSVKSVAQAILIFNCPFNLVKCLLSVVVTMLTYKKLSPILKGNK